MNNTWKKSQIFIQLISLSIFFIAFNCSGHKKILSSFNKYAHELEGNYIKDKSLSIFTTNLYQINDNWILEGETTNLVLHSNLIRFTDSLLTKEGYTNNFILLPDSSLGDSSFAIVNVSVTPLREKPQHSSQMVDQAIMGNTVKLLRYNDGWYLAQTHYDYVGWISKTGLHICDSITKSNWENQINYTTKNLQGSIFSLPYETSQPIADMVLNNVFVGKMENKNWVSLLLPDGRSGFAKKNKMGLIDKTNKKSIKPDSILYQAYKMMGIPYLWGGNSTKGNDCSGFTQIIFKANGLQLPRDARQQALEGIKITPNEDWSNILEGDLLFFGREDRVTHVGISLGKKDFIHQGGKVGINSLDERSADFSQKRLESFLFIKRILVVSS